MSKFKIYKGSLSNTTRFTIGQANTLSDDKRQRPYTAMGDIEFTPRGRTLFHLEHYLRHLNKEVGGIIRSIYHGELTHEVREKKTGSLGRVMREERDRLADLVKALTADLEILEDEVNRFQAEKVREDDMAIRVARDIRGW